MVIVMLIPKNVHVRTKNVNQNQNIDELIIHYSTDYTLAYTLQKNLEIRKY